MTLPEPPNGARVVVVRDETQPPALVWRDDRAAQGWGVETERWFDDPGEDPMDWATVIAHPTTAVYAVATTPMRGVTRRDVNERAMRDYARDFGLRVASLRSWVIGRGYDLDVCDVAEALKEHHNQSGWSAR